MGSPDFAVVSLKRLIDEGHEIVGVVSVPDKPQGRGKKLTPMPVKAAAAELGLGVYTPATLKDGAFLEVLDQLKPDMITVVAYGKILPKYVLDYPEFGCVNVHGSLLPEYRGAAPMQRALIDGKKKTGVTVQMMDVGLDTGDMLLKREYLIRDDDDFETVHDALAELGADALAETVKMAASGRPRGVAQDESQSTYAEKITKEEGHLNYSEHALSLHNRIRGMSPFPLSYSYLADGSILKIVKARVSDKASDTASAGEVISLDGGAITVCCGEGAIDILAVLPQGKGRMPARDYINGRKIKVGDILA